MKIPSIFAVIVASIASLASGADADYTNALTNSWANKVFLWVTAKDATTIDRTWTGDYVELWRDWRNPNSGWAIGNYRRATSAVTVYDGGDASHPNIDFKAYADWGTRMKIFAVVNGAPTTNKVANGVNDPDSTKFPSESIVHVMTVFGSQRGGGRGIMNNALRGGTLTNPPYTDPIFKDGLTTWVDGEKVNSKVNGFNGGWQLISFQKSFTFTSGWKLGDNSGANGRGGGQRFGEIVFFKEALTVKERISAEKWLADKWGLSYTEAKPGVWTLPNEEYGDTFAIQMTNVVKQAEAGDTIQIKPGSYSMDSVYMKSGTYTISSGTVAWNVHVYPNGKMLNFVGVDSSGNAVGHWDNQVTITGNGCFYKRSGVNDDGTSFSGITFKGFRSCENPAVTPSGGNLTADCLGGAIRGSSGIVAENCIFEENVARVAGAVDGLSCTDCKFVRNEAKYAGGAAHGGNFVGCEFSENFSGSTAGVLWWSGKIQSCNFYTNHAGTAGAVNTTQNTLLTNCVFRGNYTVSGEGGAMLLRARNTIVDCVFEDNYAVGSGGAIFSGIITVNGSTGAEDGNGAYDTRVVRCAFNRNYSSKNMGGAIYFADYKDNQKFASKQYYSPSRVTDCSFIGNFTTTRAGAVYGGTLSNCTFAANYCNGANEQTGVAVYNERRPSNNCDIVGCQFADNVVKGIGALNLGTSIVEMNSSGQVRDCMFAGNVITNTKNAATLAGILHNGSTADLDNFKVFNCTFVSNTVWQGSMVYKLACTNCDFRVNEMPWAGGVLSSSKAVDCRLIGNRKWDYYHKGTFDCYNGCLNASDSSASCDGVLTSFTDCTMDGGVICKCVLNRCYIPSCTNAGSYCLFYGGQNFVTNTLIVGPLGCPYTKGTKTSATVSNPTQFRGIIYDWGGSPAQSKFVNCTFADLTIQSNALWRIPVVVYKGLTEVVYPIDFINCICHGYSYNGVTNDFAMGFEKLSGGSISGISMYNCMSGVFTNYSNVVWSNFKNNLTVSEEDQRLVLTEDDMKILQLGKASPKYSLKSSSPGREVGDPAGFTDSDVDLAGNPRLRKGKIDIGAYECWLNFMGTRLRFK